MGCERASTLRDEVRVGYAVLVGCIDKLVNAVVDIFLQGVVDRALTAGATCPVIVDTQSATAVDKVDGIAHLVELDIELGCLAQGCLYASYLCNLAADVEMDQSKTVFESFLLEGLHGL